MTDDFSQHDFSSHDLRRIEATTQEIGRHIFERMSRRQPTPLERRWWDDRIMAWAMQDESVKVQAFRFIDVLPMLSTSEQIIAHIQEYFRDVSRLLPGAARLGLAIAQPRTIAGRALAAAARKNALSHARRFIAGTNVAEVLAAAMRERKLKRAFTLDILGEAVASEVEAQRYLQLYLDLIDGVAPVVNAWPEVPHIDRDGHRELPRVNLSVKLSALDSQFDAIDPEGTIERVGARLRPLLRAARARRVHVHVDMESYQAKDLTLAIFKRILAEDEFRDWPDVGIVIQCYLKDAAADLVALRDWARERGAPVWVRLVKGAYWDYETVHSQATGWPVPVYRQKWQSDANFERLARFLMRNHAVLRPALASHNLRSLSHGLAAARHLGLPVNGFELQMLYGMADSEKQVLVDLGYRMRVYMPYGDLIPGMAYLVRRLLENTSNDSFLKASFTDQAPVDVLMADPATHGPWPLTEAGPRRRRRYAIVGSAFAARDALPRPGSSEKSPVNMQLEPFTNEPPADFTQEADRRRMQTALTRVLGELGGHYPLFIGGQTVDTAARGESRDPSFRDRVVGTTARADAAHAGQAVEAARAAWPAWHALGVEARAEFLLRAADAMRERRFELASWQVFECGKPWREADADVCEAIDFCEFYAREALALAALQGVDVPGEENRFLYHPRGVVAVIAPWNFPLAILAGMTVAALATGNTVVMKPAEQAPVNAWRLMEIFRDLNLPAGVLNYLPGPGEIAGAALVEHPHVAVIAFTGSRAVGLAINRRAAEVSAAGAPQVKRVIAEMGGKNAIIVDDDADLDEAVQATVKSAFGYQGQKCSACSRAIVLSRVYDVFLERLIEAARSLKLGPAESPSTSVGPLIDENAVRRVREYIAIGQREGRAALAVDAAALASRGNFVGPHIFADVPSTSRLAQEEIFGPVLAVIRAADLDEAFRIFNDVEYALTGGLFSRSPDRLDRARRELLVGNLYLNRGITGALVCRQPFGGFKMSGIGSKAGGRDYLLQFVVPRTITENTMRRGFAPPAT